MSDKGSLVPSWPCDHWPCCVLSLFAPQGPRRCRGSRKDTGLGFTV